MKILAVEFSSPERSVALLESSPSLLPLGAGADRADEGTSALRTAPAACLHEAAVLSYAVAKQSDSVPALHLIERVLREAGLEREAVECIALGVGPGSYTGIRSAISLAQGWQLGRNVKLLGIGSMECLAAQAFASRWTGRLCVTVDAQRGELYLAVYEISESGWRLVEPLTITSPASLLAKANDRSRVIGPEASRWTPSGQIVFPDAKILGQIAAMRTDYLAGEKLEPIYLREANFAKAPPPRTLPPLPAKIY
jgi:tRNA threonylcarbamoyl adenosine modification protein YeaZ